MAGTDSAGCCICVTGEGNWCEVQCVLITEVLLSSFLNTGDIYKILSNILGAPLWTYT